MLANYHTHTVRCKHAHGTEREYIEAAIENGFKILGFSDHTPQPYPPEYVSNIRMDMNEVENYTDTLVKLRDEYKNDIQIYIGYEVEYTANISISFWPIFVNFLWITLSRVSISLLTK